MYMQLTSNLMDSVYLGQEIERLITQVRQINDTSDLHQLLYRANTLEDVVQQGRIPQYLAVVRINKCEILYQLREYQQVIAISESITAELGNLRQHDLHVRAHELQARAYAALQDWSGCHNSCRRGIDIIERYRYEVTAAYLQNAYLKSRVKLYANAVHACYHLQDFPQMLHYAELSKSRLFLGKIHQNTVPEGQTEPILQELRRIETQIDNLPPSCTTEYINRLRQKRRSLFERLQLLQFNHDHIPDFDLATFQYNLAREQACLYYYWIDTHTLLICLITHTACHTVVQPVSNNQREKLQSLSHYILQFKTSNPRSHLASINKFSDLLLPQQIQDSISESITRLLLCPHRLLHSLPLHALSWQHKPLIYRFAIGYTPNITAQQIHVVPTRPHRLLALGIRDYALKHKLDPITTAESEVRDIQSLYLQNNCQADILLNEQCTESRLQQMQQKLQHYDCLHLNMHGQNIDGDTPMEARLYLYDSELDGLDIPRLALGATTVILSACCSGQRAIAGRGLSELPGDELFGLQAAFFSSGTRVLLASLWPVESSSAKVITYEFHKNLLKGDPPDVALQHAIQVYLFDAPSLKQTAYYWASYFVATIGSVTSTTH